MLTRRRALQFLSALGVGTPVFSRALAAMAQGKTEITKEMVCQAQWISGVKLSDEELEQVTQAISGNFQQLNLLREIVIDPATPPAIRFEVLDQNQGQHFQVTHSANPVEQGFQPKPESAVDIAYLPVTELSQLLRTGQLQSVELTELYLNRLKTYDPLLRCVVNLTEELAMRQAAQADKEIAAGIYRGPLHGIPWGAKDLISVPEYPTTWGIPLFKDRIVNQAATVVERLQAAGSVLIAKLSLGAIAMGDKWFGQMTRNPWNAKGGSSGSSAGSAAATAAGCVGFALGTETLGSIISPSLRCGTTGLRPTFGRVSRHGCMPLAWTMDKVGPIARSVEDCALIFAAIHGADGRDQTAVDRSFHWPTRVDLQKTRVGVLKKAGDAPERDDEKILRGLGCQVVEIELPKRFPLRAMTMAIDVEGAEIFQQWLTTGQTEGWNEWPGIFRAAHFVSAVDYLKLMRVRRQLMEEMELIFKTVDVMFNCNDLVHTNLTGHPSVVFPWRVSERDGTLRPRSVTFTGRLFDEATLLTVAHAFQSQVDGHLQHPPIDKWLDDFRAGKLDAPAENTEPKQNPPPDDPNKSPPKSGNGGGN